MAIHPKLPLSIAKVKILASQQKYSICYAYRDLWIEVEPSSIPIQSFDETVFETVCYKVGNSEAFREAISCDELDKSIELDLAIAIADKIVAEYRGIMEYGAYPQCYEVTLSRRRLEKCWEQKSAQQQ